MLARTNTVCLRCSSASPTAGLCHRVTQLRFPSRARLIFVPGSWVGLFQRRLSRQGKAGEESLFGSRTQKYYANPTVDSASVHPNPRGAKRAGDGRQKKWHSRLQWLCCSSKAALQQNFPVQYLSQTRFIFSFENEMSAC